MKKILLTCSWILTILGVKAQTSFIINAGTTVTNSGSAFVLSTTFPGPFGSFINDGTFTDVTSPDDFLVYGDFTFSGTGTTTVYNFKINQGYSILNSTVTVMGSVLVGAGDSLSPNIHLALSAGATLVNNGYLSGTNTVLGLVTNATATTGACPFSPTLSHNVSGTNMIYQWQSSPDNLSWTNVATGGIAATYVPTIFVATYYRCLLSTTTINGAYSQATPGVLLTPTAPSISATGGGVFCTPGSGLSLSASGAGVGGTYTWTPASGLSASTGSAVTATPASNITYTVTGITTLGCSGTATATVTVSTSPTPSYTTAPGANTCEGVSVVYTTQTGQTNYTWSVPGTVGTDYTIASGGIGTSSSTVTLQWYTSGSKTVTVNYTSGGCAGATAASSITTVQTAPTIASITPTVSIPGTSVTITGTNFNATAANNIVYFGSVLGTVTAASGTSLTVTVPQDAVYYPNVSVDNNTCALAGWANVPYLPTYNNAAYVANTVNFDPRYDLSTVTQIRGIAFGDMDGDGKADLVVASYNSTAVMIYMNISTSGSISASSFASAVTITNPSSVMQNLSLADMDGDGKLDIITSSVLTGTNKVAVFRNTSTGVGSITFAAALTVATAGTSFNALTVGDLDGDGRADIISASSTLLVYRNLSSVGSLSFSLATSYSSGSTPIAVVLADMDGDGKKDIVAGNIGSVSVLLNTSVPGTIGLATHADFTITGNAIWVVAADIDGDGKSDVLSANGTGGVFSILRNSSTGIGLASLASPVNFTSSTFPSAIGVADADGDGKPDVYVANQGNSTLSLYRNTATSGSISSSSLAAKVNFAVAGTGAGLAVGDFDGDGTADAVTSPASSGTSVSFLRGAPLNPVTGPTQVCIGAPITLSDATATGTWSSSNSSLASVNSTSGVVTGLVVGSVTITYSGSSAGGPNLGNYTTYPVTVNAAPIASVSASVAICNGSSTGLTASGTSTSFTWSPATGLSATTGASVTASPISNTTYTVTGIAGACSNAATVTVSVNPLPTITPGAGASICSGASATISASGAVSYTWVPSTGLSATTGSSVTASPAATTSYTVTGTSALSCSNTAQVNIIISPSPTISSTTGNTVCAGGNSSVSGASATGSYIAWYNLVTAGTLLGYGTTLSITGAPATNTNYFAEANTLTGSSTLATGLSGTNTVRSSGYTVTAAVPVAINSIDIKVGTGAVTVSMYYRLGAVSNSNINNSSGWILLGNVNVNLAVAGLVNLPFPSPLVLVPGSYGLCFYTSTAANVYTQNALGGTGSVAATNSDLTLNYGLGTSGNFSGTLFGTARPPLCTIYYSSSAGCSSTPRTAATLTVNPLPTISVSSSVAICNGSSTGLTASGTSASYSWSPATSLSASTGASVTANPTGTTTYTVTGSNGTCSNTATVTVTVNAIPTVTAPGVAYCTGSTGNLTASGATTYTWAPTTGLSASTGATVAAIGTGSVTYTVTGTTSGCSNTATATTTVNAVPTIIAGANLGYISAFAGDGTSTYAGDGTPATSTGMNVVIGMVSDGSGNTYYSENASYCVRKVNSAGIVTTVVGTTGVSGSTGDGGAATAAKLNNPWGLTLDALGNLYIADAGNGRIRKVSTAGIITTVAGGGGSTAEGVAATAASLPAPVGVVFDASGNMYISDRVLNKIRRVNTSGIITTVAGTGTSGVAGDGGPATAAQLRQLATLAIDAAGNLYTGDDAGSGRIRKINTAGIITTYAGTGTPGYSGDGGPATAAQIGGFYVFVLATDASGNLYIPDFDHNILRIVSPSGIISRVAGNFFATSTGDGGPASAAALNAPISVCTDVSGNIYLAENGSSLLRKITMAASGIAICSGGAGTTLTGSGAGIGGTYSWAPAAGLSATTGVSVTANPTGTTTYTITGTNSNSCTNTYSVTVTVNTTPTVTATGVAYCPGGSGNITASGATTYAWSPATGIAASTGATVLASAGVSRTYSVTGTTGSCSATATAVVTVNTIPTVTATGVSYCTGSTGNLTASGATTYTWAPTTGLSASTGATVAAGGTGAVTYTVTGTTSGCSGTATAATTVNALPALTLSGTGGVALGTISAFAGNGTLTYSGDGTPATANGIKEVLGLTADGSGNIYFIDQDNYCVRKVNSAGIVTTVAGVNNSAGFSGDGGPATAAKLGGLGAFGIIFDAAGNLYLSDYANDRVRRVSTSGIITTVVGGGASTADGVAATAASISNPAGLAFDASGNLYVALRGQAKIRMVSLSGTITTVAGTGTTGSGGDGGPATAAQLNQPTGLAIDATGNLYIGSDGSSYRIRKVNTLGVISTYAGTGTTGYSGDGGPATAAKIGSFIYGLATDASGNLYMPDWTNNRLRMVSSSGIITTIAGTGTATSTGNGGPATTATVNSPAAVCLDNTGNIYVGEYSPGRVRKITMTASGVAICTGGTGTTLTGSGAGVGGTYSWAPATGLSAITGVSVTANPTVTTTYTITGTNTNSCTNTATITVTVNTTPTVTATGVAYCTGGSGNITASGATTYAWSPATGIAASTGATVLASAGITRTYTVTGTTTGCSATATAVVTVTSPAITGTLLFPIGTTSQLASTPGGGVWLSVSSGVASVNSSTGLATGLTAGTSLISYTAAGCTSTATVTVNTATSLNWYSVTTGGDASVQTNWWSNNNNSGYQPTLYSTTNTTWNFQSAMTSTAPLSFTGNVLIVSGGTFTPLSTSTTTVGGNWTNTGGTFINTGGTVVFNGANGVAADTISGTVGGLTGTNKFNHLTFNSPTATYTFLANAADVSGDFLLSTGTIMAPSSNLKAGGNFTNTSGNFRPNGGTVTMTGSSSTLAVAGMTTAGTNCFNSLSFNTSAPATFTISANVLLTGNFSNLTTFGTMNLGSTTLTVGGNWTNAGPFTTGAGRQIIYNGTSPVSISGNQ
jgi:hypothetical protein